MNKYILFSLIFFLHCTSNNKNQISSKKEPVFLLDKKGNCPINVDSIIKYAELKFSETYGDAVLSKRPFTVTLDSSEVWLISGTPKFEESKVFPGVNSIISGVPYMRLSKKDCQIIQISHTK